MGYRKYRSSYEDYGWIGVLGLILVLVAWIWIEVQVACWLWGIIMVGIFSLPALTGWQMFGLMILAGLILPTSHVSN